MATIKSFTDISQSRTLSKILPPESADMWYWEWPTAPRYNSYKRPMPHKGEDIVNVPCWSLAALLNTLPSATLDSSNDHHYRLHCMERFTEWYDNPIDACVAMIEKLHEQNIL